MVYENSLARWLEEMEMYILRTRAERRKNDWKKAKRQVQIEKDVDGTLTNYPFKWTPLLKHLHAYVKENVPYSGPWNKYSFEPSKSDQRKLDSLAAQEEELSDVS